MITIIIRPGVSGAHLQTSLLLIDLFIDLVSQSAFSSFGGL